MYIICVFKKCASVSQKTHHRLYKHESINAGWEEERGGVYS